MHNILYQMKKLLPSLNKKRQTWRMIRRACNKLGALLFCVPLKLDGYFVPAELTASGKPEIYVNSALSEDLQIATTVHELKHALLDPLTDSILLSHRGEWTAAARRRFNEILMYEYEACAMGAISLLPVSKLKDASRGLFDEEDAFIEDIWRIRLDLRATFGI